MIAHLKGRLLRKQPQEVVLDVAGVGYRVLIPVSTFYRLAWSDYRNTPREDWNHIIGLELSYQISEAVRCHSSLLYSHNDSNARLGFNDYEAFQTGLGVGLSAQF